MKTKKQHNQFMSIQHLGNEALTKRPISWIVRFHKLNDICTFFNVVNPSISRKRAIFDMAKDKLGLKLQESPGE